MHYGAFPCWKGQVTGFGYHWPKRERTKVVQSVVVFKFSFVKLKHFSQYFTCVLAFFFAVAILFFQKVLPTPCNWSLPAFLM